MLSRQKQHRSALFARLPLSLLLLGLLSLPLFFNAHSVAAAAPHVDTMVLNGEINSASLRLLTRTIATAQQDGARAVVIQLDTPGGDIGSMNDMTKAELNSQVPIISYVSPTGGRAASAGAFVALAAQIAAMAPTTRIGASSPVSASGGDIESTLKSKIVHDLVASIQGIQRRYQRNVDLATRMVTDAQSYDDVTAKNVGLIDYRANTLSDLLNQVNGRSVTLVSGRIALQTSGASVQTVDASFVDSAYNLLLDPNIIFLLFVVAIVGLFAEFTHPGAILPGVVGTLALLLFLFGAGSIGPNWAGLALMSLALILLVLDIRMPTHGVLTVGAMLSLVFGTLIFFNSGGPYNGAQVNPVIVYIMAGFVGLFGFLILGVVLNSRRKAIMRTGVEGMIGARARTLTALMPVGRVSYGGEDWAATLDDPTLSLDPGMEVQIVSVEGLRLYVRPMMRTFPTATSLNAVDDAPSEDVVSE